MKRENGINYIVVVDKFDEKMQTSGNSKYICSNIFTESFFPMIQVWLNVKDQLRIILFV